MAHDYIKDMVDDQTGRASTQIVAALLGGVMLLSALAASFIFKQPFYSGVLAFIAAVLLGTPLVWAALQDLVKGRTQMNELAALSFVAAFAAGQYLTAGAIAFFMILSTLVESRTALGARKAIEGLIRLTPTRASKLVNNTETDVEAKSLVPGDVIRVRPGDNIPADGAIVTGSSAVNQANITGESLPIDKSAGDEVFGGTTNLTGVLDIRVAKAGGDTTLGRVQQLVLQAEMTKTPAQRLADKYAAWYTPVILMIGVIVLVFTGDLNRVIALLIVACPSSIILATPTAMVAALSAAARLGILVKDVADFERARNLSAIIFDKTGTVTTGKLSVTRLAPVTGVDPADLLSAAASVEQNSKHPVARAVVEIARKARIDAPAATDFSEVAGKGVTGTYAGQSVVVGRESWLKERGIDTSTAETPGEGISVLYIAQNNRLLGWVGLEDQTRSQASGAMDALRDLGIRQLVMVTGDRWSVARKVAREMHCTDVQAEVLPAQKLAVVDGLKSKGHTVAVVGDGVNDAPALAAGDLSIAMGAAGSDVAINSASIALMNSNLNRIPFLVDLSRKAHAVIWQGVLFSVFYIVILIAFTSAYGLNPVVAAILHALSSVVVVFNSARLVREGENLDTEVETPESSGKETLTPEPVQATPAMA
jgi:Zn2+/Cd2+-exporting ATPase